MNYKTSMTLQGTIGVLSSIFFFLLPEWVLDFVALDYDSTSIILIRLLSLFVFILCLVLLFIRHIKEPSIQKEVLLANMIGDFLIALLLVWATVEEQLTYTGGWIFALFMLGNSLSYIPAYWKLRGRE